MKTILCLFLLTFTNSSFGQSAPASSLNEFFRNKTKIDNPLELRDPFKSPAVKSEGSKNRGGFFRSSTGQYSNIVESAVDAINLQELKVVGVLIGKERRVMIQARESDKNVIILKEGMKIGPDSAELKAILPGGIILVEKIINVYGQEEFLETVIPISK